jgi:hypothetical protein
MDNKNINNLEKEINLLIKKKNDIQNNCIHKNRYVKFTGNGNEIKQYCSNCNKELGYPDKNDLNEFLNK